MRWSRGVLKTISPQLEPAAHCKSIQVVVQGRLLTNWQRLPSILYQYWGTDSMLLNAIEHDCSCNDADRDRTDAHHRPRLCNEICVGDSIQQRGAVSRSMGGDWSERRCRIFGSIGALWFWRHHKIKKITEPQRVTTFPPVEPTIPMSEASQLPQSPQELASPEQQGMSPRSPRLNLGIWPVGLGSSPPSYDAQRARAESLKGEPQELPGSTFIHEHHPAFMAGQEPPSPTSPSTPKTPTRSFTGGSDSGSPMVTPSSSAPANPAPRSPPVVSPLNSPKLPPGRRT